MKTAEYASANYISVRIAIGGDTRKFISGRIWSASEHFFRLWLRAPVGTAEQFEISLDGCSVPGEVVFCQPCAEGYNVGVQLLERNSIRNEPRFPVDLPAVLTIIGAAGPNGASVRLADISASGVGLFSGTALPVGSCVEVKLDLGLLFGEVRYCQEEKDKRFRVGIKIYHLLAREDAGKPIAPAPPPQRFAWLRRYSASQGREII